MCKSKKKLWLLTHLLPGPGALDEGLVVRVGRGCNGGQVGGHAAHDGAPVLRGVGRVEGDEFGGSGGFALLRRGPVQVVVRRVAEDVELDGGHGLGAHAHALGELALGEQVGVLAGHRLVRLGALAAALADEHEGRGQDGRPQHARRDLRDLLGAQRPLRGHDGGGDDGLGAVVPLVIRRADAVHGAPAADAAPGVAARVVLALLCQLLTPVGRQAWRQPLSVWDAPELPHPGQALAHTTQGCSVLVCSPSLTGFCYLLILAEDP